MKFVLVNYNLFIKPIEMWIKKYTDDWLIYDRSDESGYINEKNIDQTKIIRTKNIGNADYDRLTYLIDNYDNLPEIFLLSKSNLFKYITREEFNKIKDNTEFTPVLTQYHKVYEPICRYRSGIYEEINNSWYAPQFERRFKTYNDWADYMGLPKPDYLLFAPGGNYILTSKEVHKWPRKFYIKMRDTLEHAVLPAEAQYVERSYYTLWS